MTGYIKASGQQAKASIAAFCSMLFITAPVGYLCGIVLEMGIPGLMIGFGC
jgi:Na+-driven multidrug efflux pump